LVVRSPLTAALGNGLGSLGQIGGVVLPCVRLAGRTSVGGGTAWTGNLAILAPEAILDAPAAIECTIRGVAVVDAVDAIKNVAVVGQLVLLENVKSTSGTFSVTRPPEFVPDTPLGVTWPGTEAVRIDWRGRQ
jgi:hypothetical protein